MVVTLENPNEELIRVKPFGVRYRCEFCHEGFMEVGNEPVVVPAVLMDPPQPIMRPHHCTKCGKTMMLPKSYPYIMWVPEEGGELHEAQPGQVPLGDEECSS